MTIKLNTRLIANLRCFNCDYVWTAPCITDSVRCPKCHSTYTKAEPDSLREEKAPRV